MTSRTMLVVGADVLGRGVGDDLAAARTAYRWDRNGSTRDIHLFAGRPGA